MKAISVYVDETDCAWLGDMIECLNEEEDIVATMVCATEIFIAAENNRAMTHVEHMLELNFGKEKTIKIVK